MLDMEVKMDGMDRVGAALRDVQPELRHATAPVIKQAAADIAEGAASRASVLSPSGLWRGKGGKALTPRYSVKEKGPYYYKVQTPGTPAGRAEAVSEFARRAVTPQGAAMVRALDAAYGGTGGGRILWSAGDELADGIRDRIRDAVDKAAKGIEQEMGGA